MKTKRLGLMAGVAAAAAIFVYLCIPGHPLGAFFYNNSPPIFRYVVSYLQNTDAFGQSYGSLFLGEVGNHVTVTLLSIAIAFAICFPAGIAASKSRLFRGIASNVVGIARSVPGIAVLFVLWGYIGSGEKPVLVALTILAAPPIFLNTIAAYGGVDEAIVEAARGMGMNRRQILLRIQTPLAAPVVIAGLRTATVEVIASATIAAYINFNTIGVEIFGGVQFATTTQGQAQIALGIFAISTLALLAEFGLTIVQRVATPRFA